MAKLLFNGQSVFCIDFFCFFKGEFTATGGDPLSKFCHDLKTAPDEVILLVIVYITSNPAYSIRW